MKVGEKGHLSIECSTRGSVVSMPSSSGLASCQDDMLVALRKWEVGRKKKDIALQREKEQRWMLDIRVLQTNTERELHVNEGWE